MKQDALAKWLKFIIVGVGFCGLLTYTVIMPRFAAYLVRQNSMLEKNVLPWLILIWISAIPAAAVMLVICIIVFIGISISICAAALSHLVAKAAEIQEENDLTV